MNLPPPFVPEANVLTGVGASSGIAIGPAQVSSHRNLLLPSYRLSPTGVEAELARLSKAVAAAKLRLAASQEALPPELKAQVGIIDAHLLLLDDPLLTARTRASIQNERCNAEQAIIKAIESVSLLLSSVADEYLRARLADVEMVGYSIIGALLGDGAQDLPVGPEGAILVVQDISPAEMTSLAAGKIAGLATERGGHTSHTAIVAQALELPAVVGAKGLVVNINNGDLIILDGRTGHVIVRPDRDTLDFYRTRQKMERSFNAEIVRCSHLKAVTLDDRLVTVLGNLELVEELPAIMSYGSEGIGLYRTEFMYLNRKAPPSEDELFETYRRVVESAAPNPVTIRTLDLGYDKLPGLPGDGLTPVPAGAGESNQALGLRGIRYCLRHRPLFKTQLRAILRASAHGTVQVMLPMISGIDELRRAQAILAEAERSLEMDGRPYSPRIPLGVMIEVPAAIFVARKLAEEAAFFSVGTNDLIQYSLAVDRGNPEVADLYQPLHPAILQMIKTILEIGRETETPVSICGDMAAGEVTAPILVGLGATILSMPPAAIPKIKRLIRMASFEEMRAWAEDALGSRTAHEARDRAARHVRSRFPELYR